MNIPTLAYSGFMQGEQTLGFTRLTAGDVGFACGKFGSNYILKMGLHYDRYVVTGTLPTFQAVAQVYTAAKIAATATNKRRATSVTGNIGESIAPIVARRKLNATVLGDNLINAHAPLRSAGGHLHAIIWPESERDYELRCYVRDLGWETDFYKRGAERTGDRNAPLRVSRLHYGNPDPPSEGDTAMAEAGEPTGLGIAWAISIRSMFLQAALSGKFLS